MLSLLVVEFRRRTMDRRDTGAACVGGGIVSDPAARDVFLLPVDRDPRWSRSDPRGGPSESSRLGSQSSGRRCESKFRRYGVGNRRSRSSMVSIRFTRPTIRIFAPWIAIERTTIAILDGLDPIQEDDYPDLRVLNRDRGGRRYESTSRRYGVGNRRSRSSAP